MTEGDHVTRILKAYGDALEGPDTQQGPALSKADVSSQETYLRCVVLLVRLTGEYVARFLPQVCLYARLSASNTQASHCKAFHRLLLYRQFPQECLWPSRQSNFD